jgi:hypothetical protein
MKYYDNTEISNKIYGINKKMSIQAAKKDGGLGVISHPETGEPIFWQDNSKKFHAMWKFMPKVTKMVN